MPSLTPQLPPDVQDCIIDQLNTDETVLLTCSLVSRSWLARARFWCFLDHEIVFNCKGPGIVSIKSVKNHERFVELLHSPHSSLPAHIGKILLDGPDCIYNTNDPTGAEVLYQVLEDMIIKHVSLLRNLRILTVQNVTWDRLHPVARTTIASMGRLTSVTWHCVLFQCLPDFFELCATSFPLLQVLKIRQVTFKDFVKQKSNNILTLPHLRFLDVILQSQLYPLLSISTSSYIQTQKIETLCFTGVYSLEDAAIAGQFIEATGPALRHLALELGEDIQQDDALPISLHKNTGLQSLEISTIHPSWQFTSDGPAWINSIISSISSHTLAEFSVWYNIPDLIDIKDVAEGVSFASIERRLLERNDILEALKIVYLKFVTRMSFTDKELRELVSEAERRLPILHNRGSLRASGLSSENDIRSEAFDGWWPYCWP